MSARWIATLSWAGIFSVAVGLGNASAQASSDRDFVSQAAMSNMAEIQLAHIAVKKAQHPDVKKFAQTMIDDHVKAQQRLADAAYGAGIKWPTMLDERHGQIKDRLSKLRQQEFDREYMKAMVDGHRDVEKLLAARVSKDSDTIDPQARATGADKPDELSLATKVDQWAAKTLPDVQAHLKEAEQVYGALGTGE